MQMKTIDLAQLKVSKLNMRRAAKDCSDLVASIRALGVLQPLLVRPDGEGYEVVAGQRRLLACQALAKEGHAVSIPCAVMEAGEDVSALEASLAENAVRLAPHEMDQYEAFAALERQGRSVPEMASHFGVSEQLIRKRLAIGNLLPAIRRLYREEAIDAGIVRSLTLASKARQTDWLALYNKGEAPPHWRLKGWLLGGEQIATDRALFDLATYKGGIVTDLFDEVSYFADAEDFWEAQNKALLAAIGRLHKAGWEDVVMLETGSRFMSWEFEQRSKKDGGKVYIEVLPDGSVTFHKGYLSEREIARAQKANGKADEDQARPERPELSQPFLNYLRLHRLTGVRAKLVASPAIALRVAVAHLIAGSSTWMVHPEPGRPHNEAIAESVAASPAQAPFMHARNTVRDLLGLPKAERPVTGCPEAHGALATLFARLMKLSDDEVLTILSLAMAETLELASPLTDDLGPLLEVDMAESWSADETFFTLLKDREAIEAILTEVAGSQALEANLTATNKAKKAIVQDCLSGNNGRKQLKGWIPRYLRFPFTCYTGRGPVS